MDVLGEPALAVRRRHLVVRLAIDDPLERGVVKAMPDRSGYRIHVAVLVVHCDQGLVDMVMEFGVPLAVEAGAACARGLRDRRIALHVLRDRELPGLPRLHLVIDPAQEIPAPAGQVVRIVETVVVVAVHVPDVNGRIEAQAVPAIFLKPHQRIVPDELADFRAPVIGPILFAPWRPGPPVVVEIDPAHIHAVPPFKPAVELPDRKIGRPEMVVDDVEDDGDALAMGRIDQSFDALRPAVRAFDRKNVRGVVPPR